MKKFEAPEMEIVRFSAEDIITTSNEFPLEPLGGFNEDELTIVDMS